MHSQLSSFAQDLRHHFAESLEAASLEPSGRRREETQNLQGSIDQSLLTSSPTEPDPEPQAAAVWTHDRFNELALQLFTLHYQLNTPYRRLCDARGATPEHLTKWQQIPAAPTSAFKEFAFTCLEEPKRTTYFESSGTTHDARSRNHHSAESLQLYHAALLPWFQRHLFPETGVLEGAGSSREFISLTPSQSDAPHSSLVDMLDAVAAQPWFDRVVFAGRCDGSAAWTLDTDQLLNAINHAVSVNRTLLLAGTAFSFVHLLDALDTRSLQLPDGSRIMETGGYKGRSRELPKADLHAELSERLGIPGNSIVTEYGMTELGSQAYDLVVGNQSSERTLKFPPWVRATVVSVETGEEVVEGGEGLVRIVDLANAFSVLSVETEDLAIQHSDGIELLGRRLLAEPRGCSLMTV